MSCKYESSGRRLAVLQVYVLAEGVNRRLKYEV